VKRTATAEQAKAAEHNRSNLRTSCEKTSNISTLRAPKRTSLEAESPTLTGHGIKSGQAKPMNRVASSAARPDQSTDGPRRVLITEVPKRQDIACAKAQSIIVQAKSLIGVNGPRRVPASAVLNKVNSTRVKAELTVSDTGKQSVKYATVAASGIPKPVSARNSGSTIPRFGAQAETGKGFLGRRFAAGK
jgi:hypothetical protein